MTTTSPQSLKNLCYGFLRKQGLSLADESVPQDLKDGQKDFNLATHRQTHPPDHGRLAIILSLGSPFSSSLLRRLLEGENDGIDNLIVLLALKRAVDMIDHDFPGEMMELDEYRTYHPRHMEPDEEQGEESAEEYEERVLVEVISQLDWEGWYGYQTPFY